LIIDDRLTQMEMDEMQQKLKLKQDNHADLEYLISTSTPDSRKLKTSIYQADLSRFRQQIQKIEIDLSAQKRILHRQEILYQEKVISEAQFEEFKYNFNSTQEELLQLKKNKIANWQTEKRIIEEELLSIQARLKVLLSEKQQHVLLAEGSGTLMKVNELQVGAFVNQGTVLSELSPDSNLIVEAYVNSSKMSLLKLGQEVNFQIHAFNYRNWGIATGNVFSISNDIEMINGQPVFKVLASLKQENLSLSNGTKGKLKKGLTLTSKFILVERSLFDLLYDKADDWLNPSNQSAQYQTAL
jgi:multidrug resistance efflux pump